MDNANEGQHTLKAGALGGLGVAALGAVMMAPALGIYANLPLISASSGKVAPAVFLFSLVLTLPTAYCYAAITREIPSAGAAYTWLSIAVNPIVGVWVGLLGVITYLLAVILQPILFGLFFNELLAAVFHIHTGYGSWMLGVVVSTGIVIFLAYPGIQISARASIVLTIIELGVVLALACTILFLLTAHGKLRFSPFNPAASLQGFHGLFQGLIFGLLTFVGFSVITTAAEEANAPRSVIPRMVMVSCILLGIFYAFTSWGFCLALPAEDWARYVAKGSNPVALVARQYWALGYILVIVTAITAVLGVYLGAMMGYARMAYAMGRDGTLPKFLGCLHPKYRVPWNAQHVALAITLVIAAVWGRKLGLYLSYDWWGTALVFFAMISYIFVNVGCTVFFYRFRREKFSPFWHVTIPLLGLLSNLLPIYFSFGPDLWRAGWARGQSIVIFCIGVVALSGLYTLRLSHTKPQVLRRSAEEV